MTKYTIGLEIKSMEECAARTLLTDECKNGKGFFEYEELDAKNTCFCCTEVHEIVPTKP
jgi:hypothetical protein